ncbi:hypothetical protein [Clostridium uliginosum]|uniref:Uncharacterized protein n=1 Tax=Clostridium uliginosum TaxID=119641 RepID=A0A1I1NHQ1_9CLOT|nr:hypothetical protein [Clostridium uliginosum]SFC97151.1 hypothetical protein SAMN05421842_11562 [Clostridium uliginosum]
MRILKYDLFPEAYGSNGRFVSKEGTVAELIIDTGMLLNADFDKVIPNLNILNKMFLQGLYPRTGEWEPFEIIQEEYEELVKYLCSLPMPRPYRSL